jgi:hypothetical protein
MAARVPPALIWADDTAGLAREMADRRSLPCPLAVRLEEKPAMDSVSCRGLGSVTRFTNTRLVTQVAGPDAIAVMRPSPQVMASGFEKTLRRENPGQFSPCVARLIAAARPGPESRKPFWVAPAYFRGGTHASRD